MKKSSKVILIIIVVILFIAGLAVFLTPRIQFGILAKNMGVADIQIQEFTDYSITAEGTRIDNGEISLSINSAYSLDEDVSSKMNCQTYYNQNHSIIIMNAYDYGTTMDLTAANFNEDNSYMDGVSNDDILYAIDKWGYETPNCAYNTLKLLQQVREADYSFWNLKTLKAYVVLKVLQESLIPKYNEQYFFYEHNGIKGFIMFHKDSTDDTIYKVQLDIYSEDNLNVSHTILIKTDSLDEAYAIMNSIEILN